MNNKLVIKNNFEEIQTLETDDTLMKFLTWLKENTPEDAVIFSWWDYGYWIETVGERTTLVDNATTITWQIEKVAEDGKLKDCWMTTGVSNPEFLGDII